MPKSNKCCPSSKSHHGSCVEKCVKECKELYCRAKYEKLACKLLKTDLIQNRCDYVADRFVDSISGAKFNWLNNFLVSNATASTVAYQPVNSANLAPASFGSEDTLREVDPTLNNYVFAYQYTEAALRNSTAGALTAVPLLQDIFQYVFDINAVPAVPGPGNLTFGTSNLGQILAASVPTPTSNGLPVLAAYTQAQINTLTDIVPKTPYQYAIMGGYGVPLVREIRYQENTADNVQVNKVARVGIIKLQNVAGANFSVSVSGTAAGATGVANTTINQWAIGVTGQNPGATQFSGPSSGNLILPSSQFTTSSSSVGGTGTGTIPVLISNVTAGADVYVLYGYGRIECPDLC